MFDNNSDLRKRLEDAGFYVDFSKSEYAYRLCHKDTGAVQARLLVPRPDGEVSDSGLMDWVENSLRRYEYEKRAAANRATHVAIWARMAAAALRSGAASPAAVRTADHILDEYCRRFEK